MKKRIILLRFDDICPTMNWEQWDKAKDVLDSIGATALLGVIPDNQDPALLIDPARNDFWEYIKLLQSQGYAVAMHGYQHVFDMQASGLSTLKKHSEFAGHPYEVQYEKIHKGKRVLNEHGIDTDIFFAPAHSYDDNTLKALSANGFRYISDGKSMKPYKRHGITCYPERTGGLPKLRKGGYYTAVLHAHEWVMPGRNRIFERFQQLCNDGTNIIVSFDEFKKWPSGHPFSQRIYEIVYLVLARIKHLL